MWMLEKTNKIPMRMREEQKKIHPQYSWKTAAKVNTHEWVIRSTFHSSRFCVYSEVSNWFHRSFVILDGQTMKHLHSVFYITKPVYVRIKLLNLMWHWWMRHRNHILPIKVFALCCVAKCILYRILHPARDKT